MASLSVEFRGFLVSKEGNFFFTTVITLQFSCDKRQSSCGRFIFSSLV